jgi:hypothetical protein
MQRCINMWQTKKLAYLPLDLCTKRTMDFVGINRDPAFVPTPDMAGMLKLRQVDDDERVEFGSQFDVLHAFQRRSIAFETADLMSFNSGEILRRFLLGPLTKAPMKGFLAVELQQCLEADQLIWNELQKKCRGGIRRQSTGARPLDEALPAVLASLPVQMAIMPRQGVVQPKVQVQEKSDLSAKLLNGIQKQLDDLKRDKHANAIQKAFGDKSASSGDPAPNKQKNAKAKKEEAQKKAKGRELKPPKGLEGCLTRSSQATGSKRMCFQFNLGQCSTKKECSQGAHLCMRNVKGEACSQTHPANGCSRT